MNQLNCKDSLVTPLVLLDQLGVTQNKREVTDYVTFKSHVHSREVTLNWDFSLKNHYSEGTGHQIQSFTAVFKEF